MEKVDRNTAEQEINAWLDNKRISEKQRSEEEGNGESVEKLIDAVVDGILTVDKETFKIKHILVHPFESDGNVTLKELEYAPRIRVADVHRKMKGVKGTDGDGRLVGYVAALTRKTQAEIKNLDTTDYNIAQAVAVFFMV